MDFIQAMFLAILAATAWIDSKTMEIPDYLPASVLVLALLSAWFCDVPGTVAEFAAGLLAVSLPMFLLATAVPGAFGGGDVKLMAACGALLGWKQIVLAAFLAILGGGCYGIWLLASGKAGRKEHFAFGPFLCAGMVISRFWGEAILGCYFRMMVW